MNFPCFKKILFLIFAAILVIPVSVVRASDEGELVKTADNSAVYFVKDDVKHVFPHTAVYLSWGYLKDYSTVKIVSAEILNSYAEGEAVKFRTGYMFRGMTTSLFGKEAEAVFIADGGKIRPIYSAAIYQTLFNDPKWILVNWIPDDFLSKFSYELGEMILSDNSHPNGTLAKYNEEPDKIYLIQDGKKQLVSNEAFVSNKFSESRIIKLSKQKYNYDNAEVVLTGKSDSWAEPVSVSAPTPAPTPTPAPEPEPAPIPQDTTVYSSYSQKHIASISYPRDWVLSDSYDKVSVRHEIYFENPVADTAANGSKFNASAGIIFEGSINNPATMEDYKKALKRITFLSGIAYDDLSQTSASSSASNDLGLKEKILEFKAEKNGRIIKQKVYDFVSGNEEIYLVMSAPENVWSNYENIFNKFRTTFKPNKDQGFSDYDDLKVTGWGFSNDAKAVQNATVMPYVDIINNGDTTISLKNTAKVELTAIFPDLTELTQEPYIRNGDLFLPGETVRMEFNGVVLTLKGTYEFKIQANSNSGISETETANNWNSDRKVTVE